MKNWNLRTGIVVNATLLIVVALTVGTSGADSPYTIATRAFELRLAGQVDEAVPMLRAGLTEHPEAAILHYELARARLFLLDWVRMQDEAESAVRYAPENNEFRYFAALASAYSLIAAAHRQDKERMKVMGQKIIDELETILHNDPNHHLARYLLVQQSVEMAPEVGIEVDDPEHQIELLEEQDPILGAKARCWVVDEQRQREIWKKILADHPGDSRVLDEAADGLITAGDLDLAERCLNEAIQLGVPSYYGLLRLGLVYAMQEDWDKATELTQQCLELEPQLALKAFAVGRLGMIHYRMGDEEQATALMEEARELDSHVWQTMMPPPREIFTPLQSADPDGNEL